jgi:hypothetical protein
LAFCLAAYCFFWLRLSLLFRYQNCFPAVCRASAIVGISHPIALRLSFVTSLHDEYHRVLTAARVITFLLSWFCNPVFIRFRVQLCFVSDSYFTSCALNTLRCACSSFPCGQSVQGATCPLTLSCIPAFRSASINYSCELQTSASQGSVLPSFSEVL